MHADRIRALCKLDYLNPKVVLENFRRIELNLPDHGISASVRHLRTNDLKSIREARDAAIFAYGMSCAKGFEVGFAPVEDQDFDFVTTWRTDDTRHVCPVQLKELVPQELNSHATTDDLIARLRRYRCSSDVTVVIKLNRLGRFDPFSVRVPTDLQIGGLWMYAAASEDQNEWLIWGDFQQPAGLGGAKFQYPKPLRVIF